MGIIESERKNTAFEDVVVDMKNFLRGILFERIARE